MSILDPKYVVPCRQTLTSNLIPRMVKGALCLLKERLSAARYVSLTVDIWTDRRQHSFLAATVHFFENGVPQSKLASFKSFKGSHTGDRIGESLDAIIEEFGIRSKLVCIVSDNAANMKKAMTVLMQPDQEQDNEDVDQNPGISVNEFDDESLWEDSEDIEASLAPICPIRVSCFAHTLQLVVRDGLTKTHSLRGAMAKCTKLSNMIHQSALFRSAFEEVFGKGRSIPAANTTRWNSTLHQIEAIIGLDATKLEDLLKKSSLQHLICSGTQQSQLSELVAILKPFGDATDLAQGDSYVTSSCVVPAVLSLNKILSKKLETVRHCLPLVTELHSSLHKRFMGVFKAAGHDVPEDVCLPFNEDLYQLSAILDPRFSFHWLEDTSLSAAGKAELKARLIATVLHYMTADSPREGELDSTGNTADHHHSQPPCKKVMSESTLFGHYKKPSVSTCAIQSQDAETQLSEYLHSNEEGHEMSLNMQFVRFPAIKPILERVWCVPATSAPVERVFSQSGLILHPNRSRISDTLLEHLVFLKCNIK